MKLHIIQPKGGINMNTWDRLYLSPEFYIVVFLFVIIFIFFIFGVINVINNWKTRKNSDKLTEFFVELMSSPEEAKKAKAKLDTTNKELAELVDNISFIQAANKIAAETEEDISDAQKALLLEASKGGKHLQKLFPKGEKP